MKKTYNISLNGRMFHCEEDAGDALQKYIETLEKHYSQEEGGGEIMEDIEARIAELLEGYMRTPGKEVVTLSDIEKIIAIMGCPDDIFNETGEAEKTVRLEKKLYRDLDHSVLGGVAAGLAAYLSTSVVIIRLIFVIPALFSYGAPLLVYIALWLVMPAARTSREKLEMKGEKINIPNIEKNIRNSINDVQKSGVLQRFAQRLDEILQLLFHALGRFGKVLLGCIAFLCLVTSVFGLLLITGVGSFLEITSVWDYPFHLSYIMSGVYGVLTKIAIALVVMMPLLMLMWLSIKYLFQLKNKTLFIPMTITGLWVLGIVLAIFVSVHIALSFSIDHEKTTSSVLQMPQDSCFVITTTPKYHEAFRYRLLGETYTTSYKNQILGMPKLKFEQSDDKFPTLVVIEKAYGNMEDVAIENVNSIDFKWEQRGDTLVIDNYFSIPETAKWRNNQVELILQLPEGYKVKLESTLKDRVSRRYQSEYRHKAIRFIMDDHSLESVCE